MLQHISRYGVEFRIPLAIAGETAKVVNQRFARQQRLEPGLRRCLSHGRPRLRPRLRRSLRRCFRLHARHGLTGSQSAQPVLDGLFAAPANSGDFADRLRRAMQGNDPGVLLGTVAKPYAARVHNSPLFK